MDRDLDLNTIESFRDQIKEENIALMLSGASTLHFTLYTSFGCTEFFEFELFNSEVNEELVQVVIEDQW